MQNGTRPAVGHTGPRRTTDDASFPWETYRVVVPKPGHPLRSMDSVELATLQVLTPGADWSARGRGALFMFASRLSSWDANGDLRGLSGFSVARKLQDSTRERISLPVPWLGLSVLAALDADDRTGIRILLDGAPRRGDDPMSRRVEERLRDRLADMPPGWRR